VDVFTPDNSVRRCRNWKMSVETAFTGLHIRGRTYCPGTTTARISGECRLRAISVAIARRGRSQGREGLPAVAAVVRLPGCGRRLGNGRVVRFKYEMSRLILRRNLDEPWRYSVVPLRPPQSRRRGPPMTLGNAAAARVRLTVWCKACQHQVEPDPADMAQRYGAAIRARLARAAGVFPLRRPRNRYGRDRDEAAPRVEFR
jgi:hypothetical protein